MRHRVVSLEVVSAGQIVRAVLEDVSPNRQWIDISCGVDSAFGQMLIDAQRRNGVIEPIAYFGQ